jgi:hypothetical protein
VGDHKAEADVPESVVYQIDFSSLHSSGSMQRKRTRTPMTVPSEAPQRMGKAVEVPCPVQILAVCKEDGSSGLAIVVM